MPPRSPFSGERLIASGAAAFERQEEEDLLNRLRRLRAREGEASFRRDFDFRPEGERMEAEAGPQSRAPSLGQQITRGAEGEAAAEARSDIAAGGFESAFPEGGGRASTPASGSEDVGGATGPSPADAVKSLRTEGGTELTPGDVREGEALDRQLARFESGGLPAADRLRRATVPAGMRENRIPLSEELGGGSISRFSPEERRQKELVGTLTEEGMDRERAEVLIATGQDLLGPDAEEVQITDSQLQMLGATDAELLATKGNPDLRQSLARELAGRRSSGDGPPITDDRLRLVGATDAEIEATRGNRSARESLLNQLAGRRTSGGDGMSTDEFLNTEKGQQVFSFFRENPDADPSRVAREFGVENFSGVLGAREEARGTSPQVASGDAVADALGTRPFNDAERTVFEKIAEAGGIEEARRQLENTLSNPAVQGNVQRTRKVNQWMQSLDQIEARISEEQEGQLITLSDGTTIQL